jgi:hypothetical protein
MIDSAGRLVASRFVDVTASTPAFTGKVTSLAVSQATATSSGRLTLSWTGGSVNKMIPYGSKVLIGRNVYTTNSDTTVGYIYLPSTTAGIAVGDAVKHIEKPDGTIIYSDVGTTSTVDKWQQVRFNFDWDFAVQPVSKIRYEIYVRSPGEYQFDETFLALLPRDPALPAVPMPQNPPPPVATTTPTTTPPPVATTTPTPTPATTTPPVRPTNPSVNAK